MRADPCALALGSAQTTAYSAPMLTIPTQLTLARIAMIPVLGVFFYLPFASARWIAAGVFVLAALTDWLDGYLARKWQQTSEFGAFLDPVADKLMVAMVLVLLVGESQAKVQPAGAWLAIPAAVIVGRELLVSALREWMAELGKRAAVAVSMVGKIKTSFQMLAITLLLVRDPIGAFPTHLIGVVLLYVAATMTLWSMVVYLRAAWPSLRQG